MSKCIFINTAEEVVRQEAMPVGLSALQAMVGGTIAAHCLENGDVLYVDDEAEYRTPRAPPFMLSGCSFRVNGVVVGINPSTGEDCSPRSALEAIASVVHFLISP